MTSPLSGFLTFLAMPPPFGGYFLGEDFVLFGRAPFGGDFLGEDFVLFGRAPFGGDFLGEDFGLFGRANAIHFFVCPKISFFKTPPI